MEGWKEVPSAYESFERTGREKLMNCRKAKKLLAKYYADGMDGKKRTALEEHLSVCRECCRKLASLERTEQLLFAIPPKEPPGGLWDALRTRIAAEEDSLKHQWRDRFVKLNPVLAMATLAMVVIFAGFFFVRSYLIQPDRSEVVTLRNSETLAAIYVEQHALRAWRDPLADKAGLGWSVQPR